MLAGNWAKSGELTNNNFQHVMLFRMMYLQTIARVERGPGLKWVIHSYADWMVDLKTTNSTVKKTLLELRSKGVLETNTWLFNGKRILHLRVQRLGDNQPKGCETTDGKVVSQPFLYINNKSINNMNKERENPSGFLIPPMSKNALVPEPELKNIIDQPVTFDTARKVWEIYWRKNYDEMIDGFPQSPKMRKMFRDWCGKVPDDINPLQLIANAVGNWSDFRETVQLRTGKQIGTRPMLYEIFWNLPSLLDVEKPEPIEIQKIVYKGDMSPNERMAILAGRKK